MENHIFVVTTDMDDQDPEAIARNFAGKVCELFDQLIREQNEMKEEKQI